MTCHLYLLKTSFFWPTNKRKKVLSFYGHIYYPDFSFCIILIIITCRRIEKHLSHHQPLDQERRNEEAESAFLLQLRLVYTRRLYPPRKAQEKTSSARVRKFSSPWVLCSPLFFCYYIFMCLYPAKILHTLHPSFSTNFCWTPAFFRNPLFRFLRLCPMKDWRIHFQLIAYFWFFIQEKISYI